MLSHEIYLLVTCLITISAAIRVDWNTNKGPIVPPRPRTTVRPLPPYRQPAPVWEDQSNDIPNPNPYIYILPPPSRPRPATNNYLTSDRRPVTQANYNSYNYGHIISPSAANSYLQNGNSNSVAGLSPRYVPNVGFKYAAVVPSPGSKPTKYATTAATATSVNGLLDAYYFGVGDKLQGKFNAKTKKYKAYEKVKYVPYSYPTPFEYAQPDEQPDAQTYMLTYDRQELLSTQQLPLQQSPPTFHQAAEATTTAVEELQQPQQQDPEEHQQKLTPGKATAEKSSIKAHQKSRSGVSPNDIF